MSGVEHQLNAISPVDGRYAARCAELREYWSESALMRYRLQVEIEYLLALGDELGFAQSLDAQAIRAIVDDFDPVRIKEIERRTNHDVKAIEYYLGERPEIPEGIRRWIHYGLTSQDINTSANAIMARDGWDHCCAPVLEEIDQFLGSRRDFGSWREVVMLSRTHGQPASPTRLWKEMMVFRERIRVHVGLKEKIPWTSKLGGAVGNFNSLYLAHPEVDWVSLAGRVVSGLGLERDDYTTQIGNYDHWGAHFDAMRRINLILIDLCRDMWEYISREYFQLKIVATEVGSSAMPHKVNPIDFENAEGNLMLANALLEFLTRKLSISRLQRDLTDSTVLRNVGVAYAHSLIAYKSLLKGLNKLEVNREAIEADLNRNWMVVAEGIQIILKREGVTDAYERVKELTRVKNPSREELNRWVAGLDISERVKEELLSLEPGNYAGIF